LVLIFAGLVSIGGYAWWTGTVPDQYNWFDFLRGKEMPGAPEPNPGGSLPAPDESFPSFPSASLFQGTLGTRLPNGALLAQSGPTTANSVPRARPVDTINVRRYVPVDPFGLFGYQAPRSALPRAIETVSVDCQHSRLHFGMRQSLLD
jgi:hypothetical protein